ncbi:hypothetical protein LA6_000007 [Marinibacterium anthonyi]|nr:hypothetical protein LA6_000007 [Marinibacterium anthonyi]
MTEQGATGRIAIIGMGPRGLGALEALATRLHARPMPVQSVQPIQVDIFDPFTAPGAGPNFDPDESPLCRLNIPMRDIAIRPPEFSAIGPFADWLPDAPDPDTFPARATLGRYLEARYADLRDRGALAITLQPHDIDHIAPDPTGGWRLRAGDRWHGPYAEVLLVPGQPEVIPDDQLAEWQRHVRTGPAALARAYPARRLQHRAADWTGRTVAIRGLALSAFDVLRVLTTGQGGRFEDGGYIASGREPARVLPFSLDGKPPSPKPATTELDARFDPTPDETRAFTTAITAAATADPETAQHRITAALLPAIARILRDTSGDADGLSGWLAAEWSDPGSQETDGPLDHLQAGIAMAEGRIPPSIGYAVGQVWRKWQDELRGGFNPAPTAPETASALVGFDEGLKRYSYGPPVSSSHELAALIKAGLVDLDLASDPDIALIGGGWRLTTRAATAEASVMIDAVLPSPDLEAVRAPLVAGLVDEGRLSPLADKLAAHTAPDGTLIGNDGAASNGLCLLGRLALGSVIAADSLHDCFGEASDRWAGGVIDRMG